ncbi:hypothetical protein Uis1B_0623 [Bifidobacterium margollesii]|uniref:Uncharacterized protein n=1 Tax=Bifidobacterium margollesii TaxID=2020964 RepID=A0A2N5JBS2_9BIFI|nr:hypothetical protein [Bifidobacterium margollesii]PLS31631.1 hypothetical protein Uis1B_0623 [Bifidobacterium margollesii]
MEPIQLKAFNGLTGAYIGRVPYSSLSGQDSISDEGSMSATLPDCRQLRLIPSLDPYLRAYGTIYAATSGDRILHAGYLTRHAMNDNRDALTLDIGGGFTILTKRKVLNRRLKTLWRDGEVRIDDDKHIPDGWRLTARGTYRDLIRALIEETLAWGPLPFELPPIQGGADHERDWDGWDFPGTWDEISDIADLDDGPEIRADPIIENDAIRFRLNVGEPEIVDHEWRWNTLTPGTGVTLAATDCDGSVLTSQHFMVGGKHADKTLVAMAQGSALASDGWPLLQTSDASHSSITVLRTLQSYARAAILTGDTDQTTHGLNVDISRDVHVGDHAVVRVSETNPDDRQRDVLLPEKVGLKITDVKWDAGKQFQTLQARPLEA